jgi:hypothetical protein
MATVLQFSRLLNLTPRSNAVINFNGLSKFSSILKQAALALACLAYAGIASATIPVVQGRWEFVVTSGDNSTQLSTLGQSIFSTYLLQNNTALTNISAFTYDTVACDTDSNNNVTVANSSVDASGNIAVDFTVTLPDQTQFHYVFTGVLGHGSPKVITGTYQRSSGGCTQGSLGTGSSDGAFTATWFPDPSGQTWMGAFDAPDVGTGPTAVSASFTLNTNSDKTLSGTISILGSGLVNSSNVACIANPVTLQPNMAEGVSQQAGAGIELFGIDANGTHVWVNAYATNSDGSIAAVGEDNPADGTAGTANDGTNNAYTAFYGISGGPCDGLGGGDAPFLLVTKKKLTNGHNGQHGRDGQRGPRNGHTPSLHSKEQ